MADEHPKIDNAPGLIWKQLADGRWIARWQARTDLLQRGYPIKGKALWAGTELDIADIIHIQQQCQELQNEMLLWGRGGIPTTVAYDGTLDGLIACYRSDEDSPYRRLRYISRMSYDKLTGRLSREKGITDIADMNGRLFRAWHREWSEGGHITQGSALMRMIRTLISFGTSILECPECERVAGILHVLRFEAPKARTSTLTAEQVIAVRSMAHAQGRPSIALAQALQFECTLRQKDVIGEWVPLAEKGISEIKWRDTKWLSGLQWQEIDQHLILRHVTSKRGKPIEVSLHNAPMVMEELGKLGDLPKSGPIVVDEHTGLPYQTERFRREWRRIATLAGIPRETWNMDTRSGAITEATNSGAPLEHVRHAATHSDVAMTQRYSRDAAQKTAEVMQLRVAHRNKGGTK